MFRLKTVGADYLYEEAKEPIYIQWRLIFSLSQTKQVRVLNDRFWSTGFSVFLIEWTLNVTLVLRPSPCTESNRILFSSNEILLIYSLYTLNTCSM